MQDNKGRRIWWAWIHEKRTAEAQATAGWAGVMSLPKVLTLLSETKSVPLEELQKELALR